MKMNFKNLSPTSLRVIGISAAALLMIPAVATARHHYVKKHRANHEHDSAKSEKADASIKPVVGTWYVNEHGKESRAQKLVLRPNKTFAFVGSGYKSEGNYSVKDGSLKLIWTSVDGEKVKPGQMHKEIALNGEMNSLVIDQYTYGKHVEGVAAE